MAPVQHGLWDCLCVLFLLTAHSGINAAATLDIETGGHNSSNTKLVMGLLPSESDSKSTNALEDSTTSTYHPGSISGLPSNGKATPETIHLYNWLTKLTGNVLLGVSEESEILRREFGVKPALLGVEYYDYGDVERRLKDREAAQKKLIEHCAAGGVISLHDHMYNFSGVKRRNYAPKENLGLRDRGFLHLGELLPGGELADDYRAYLKRMASFVNGIRVNGVQCPVLFRPFHEMNGRWFWWGGEENADKLVSVWRHTHKVLVHEEGLNNLIWVWSPSVHRQNADPKYDMYWPGREYVDVVGLDGYADGVGGTFGAPFFLKSYEAMMKISNRERLPFAWTEIGFAESGRNQPNFWTNDVLTRLRTDYSNAKYFLLWHGKWLPRVDSAAGESARKMMLDDYVITLDRINPSEVYGIKR